jgi:hypothetical protein
MEWAKITEKRFFEKNFFFPLTWIRFLAEQTVIERENTSADDTLGPNW